MRLDVQALKEAADVQVVAEELGLPMQQRGKNISILCPKHDDKHFGNCYLTKHGYKCYACGARGDVIELIQDTMNLDFMGACHMLADICGGEELFYKTGESSSVETREAGFLTRAQQAMLGIRNTPIWVEREMIEEEDEAEDSDHLQDVLDAQGCCVGFTLMNLVDRDPLHTLYVEDIETYHELVEKFCAEAIDRYRITMDLALANQVNIQNQHLRALIQQMRKINRSELIQFFSTNIKAIQQISLACGTGACAGALTDIDSGTLRETDAKPMNSDLIAAIQVQMWQQANVPF